MLRIIGLVFILATLTLRPASAEAAEDWWWQDIQRQGFSLGLGASVGGMASIEEFQTGLVDIEPGTAGGLNIRAGYRLPRWIGFDLHFEWLTSDTTVDFARQTSIDLETWWITFTGDVKFILPRWANSEFFLTVGPGLMTIDGNTEFAARYGGGVDIYFTRHIGMTLGGSYVMPINDLKDLDYAVGEAGLFYRF
jgi:hypothetical protein